MIKKTIKKKKKISRKNNIENMIPIIIELKRYLQNLHSPLVKNLMAYLRSVVQDFRVEMEGMIITLFNDEKKEEKK